MNKIDLKKYKEKLDKELANLEKELESVGRRNPSNPNDWEAKQPEENIPGADLNEVADSIDDFESNSAILNDLEAKYNNVKLALEKIEEETYGLCEVDGKPIEEARLEANPSARTCKEHINTNLR
ncbi:hypothetical protein A2442_00130 [Candidatus Campbellbacteria bacterium RIFOXYC2_FULL_35_25]|uniref:Zinc finger DksA/TraR C4-type domain-containing protein n=1 Tax=Candidatus Campbellbacteria bacterium RIFOXYC2_FULL_35_25 TaxID=1797582 RepID=A0A1F5EHU6_9BACT|nr:MAG: hypothetical protein A2442_00130 [Candidatus Campbellbacteria bacterium RIFOXYC2_FULL_35_25]